MNLRMRSPAAALSLGVLSGAFYAAWNLPFVSFAVMLCAVPLAVASRLLGPAGGVGALACAAGTVAAVLSPYHALAFFLAWGACGLCLGLAARSQSAGETFLAGLTATILGMTALGGWLFYATGQGPAKLLVASLTGLYRNVLLQAPQVAAYFGAVRQAAAVVPTVFPSILVLSAMWLTALSYGLSSLLLRRTALPMPKLPKVTELRMPSSVLWAYLFSLAALVLSQLSFQAAQVAFIVGVNLELVIRALLLVQGLSLAGWWAKRFGLSGWISVPLLIAAVAVPVLEQGAVVLGVVDLWLDIRKRYGGVKQ